MSIELLMLGLAGITIIITSSKIFENIRNRISEMSTTLGELVNCPMCTGFWTGFFFGIMSDIAPPLVLGGLISLLSWSIYTFVDYISTKGTWYAVQILKENNAENVEDNNEQ